MTDVEQIAEILRDNITFSGQVGDYVIHGAIEKILERENQESIAFAKWIQANAIEHPNGDYYVYVTNKVRTRVSGIENMHKLFKANQK